MTDTVTLFVSDGRTVVVGEWTPGVLPERRGPGEKVELSRADADRLREAGFVQDTPPDIAPPKPTNAASIGLQNVEGGWQGPVYDRPSPG